MQDREPLCEMTVKSDLELRLHFLFNLSVWKLGGFIFRQKCFKDQDMDRSSNFFVTERREKRETGAICQYFVALRIARDSVIQCPQRVVLRPQEQKNLGAF